MSKPFLSLKQRIMWRIYAIWAMRAALSRTALKAYLLLLAFLYTTKFISYSNVLSNVPLSDPAREYAFFQGALSNTETPTIFLLFGMIILILWVIFDFLPSLHKKQG